MGTWNMSAGSGSKQLDLEAYKACLEDIGARLKRGALSEAEADAARLDLLTRPRTMSWRDARIVRTCPPAMVVAISAFLIVAGIGAATSYLEAGPEAAGGKQASGSDSDVVARLTEYARSIPANEAAGGAPPQTALPDVDTMIARLASRLETSPDDLDGWTMLGRSYFHTARYAQAADAFGKALALNPTSAELAELQENAKALAAAPGGPGSASVAQSETPANPHRAVQSSEPEASR